MNLSSKKAKFLVVRPTRALLFFFTLVFASFLLFVGWELYITKYWLVFGTDAPELAARDWLFLIGLMSGLTGWVCSSFVTLRNSIKQHTVNTYVQSRLSSPYSETNKRVNLEHFAIGRLTGPIPKEFFTNTDNADKMHDINTVLNYFEFIAVGIRHGDLDESFLREVMGGIITRMCSKAGLYLAFIRNPENGLGGARTFEHLLWLNERWNNRKA
jgi:hypothetical protein